MTKYEGDPIDLIKTINKEMGADQVVENIQLYNELEHNSSQSPTEAARAELLRRSGYDPQDWVFYSNFLPHFGKEQPNEQDLEMLGRNFPPEVEFLIVQGAVLGGATGTPGQGSWGWARYKYYPKEYSVFVRVKKQIE